jgi:hypothetical protein
VLIPKFRIFERWIFPAKIAPQKPMYRCYDPLKKRPPTQQPAGSRLGGDAGASLQNRHERSQAGCTSGTA